MFDFLGSAAGLTFAVLLVAATFLLYFFKHLTESFERRRMASQRTERLVGALYAEIHANLNGVQDFIERNPRPGRSSAPKSGLVARHRPHLPAVAHNLVYESNVGELAALPNAVVVKVVGFYSQMERNAGLIDAIERASFAELAPEQRAQVIEDLWRNLDRSLKLGREALHALEVHLPMMVMKRALAAA